MRWLILAYASLLMAGCSESVAESDVVFPIVAEPDQIQSTAQGCSAPITLQNLSTTSEYTIVFLQITALNAQEEIYQKVYDSEQFVDIFGGTQLPPTSELTATIELSRAEADLGAGPLDVSLLLIGAQFREIAYFTGQWICE